MGVSGSLVKGADMARQRRERTIAGGFGNLRLVQQQEWRVRHLTLDELAILMHEAEKVDDDLTVIAVEVEVRRRDLGDQFREVYMGLWKFHYGPGLRPLTKDCRECMGLGYVVGDVGTKYDCTNCEGG